MTGLLDGRVAVVTGAGSGSGRAIAGALVAEGARVIVADNGTSAGGEGADPSVVRGVAAALGKNSVAFADSVASPGAAKLLVEMAVANFGGLDIVVNNARIRRDVPVAQANPGDWDAVIRNNLSAAFYLSNAASTVMRDQHKSGRGDDWGRIFNIASPAGLYGSPGQAAFASAQAGLVALTRAMASDLAPEKITANAVAPVAPADGESANDAASVAAVVAALCLPAGKAITGQVLGVRGREIFLFGQPRPVARLEAGAAGPALAQALSALVDRFARLEAFDAERRD